MQITLNLRQFFTGYLEGREYETEGRGFFANYPAMLKLKDWPPRVRAEGIEELVQGTK